MARRVNIKIVRHGETNENRAKIIQGHVDTLLNAEGEAQARVTAAYFKTATHFDQIWVSDLKRAYKTADTIQKEQREPAATLQVDVRVRERFLGNLQGKRRDESTREDALTIEPQAVLRNRLFSFWDDILARAAALPPGTDSTPALEILVVSHGGSIRCLVQDLLLERREDYTIDWDRLDPKGEGVEKRIGNCCVSEFQMRLVEEPVGGLRWKGVLVRYADESHFDESSRAPSPTENEDVIVDRPASLETAN